MSEKKRVRVYRPQVNTEHFANYMFQVGGPVEGQAIPQPQMQQMQSGDMSQDIVQLLQMYAQATGIGEDQLQQMYAAIMQMEPDKQAETINQIQQELAGSVSANPMVAKNGGDIKSTKKLLTKKIGGVSTNMTSSNVVDMRKQIVKDVIGSNMVKDLVNQETESKLTQANSMLGNAAQLLEYGGQPRMDDGGYASNMYNMQRGYSDVDDNPFYDEYLSARQEGRNIDNLLMQGLGNIKFGPSTDDPIKIKRRGDMFKNPSVVSTNPPAGLTSNEAAEKYFGLKDGGGIPQYQGAGTTRNVEITDHQGNTKYVTAEEAETWYNAKQSQPNITINDLSFASESPNAINQNTNNQTGAGGINGWKGGYFWKDGVAITSIWDIQQQQQQQQNQNLTNDITKMFQSGDMKMRTRGNLFNIASNPELVKQIGKGLSEFQPDNVYMSKAKGSVNPFRAKVVFKWDYDENGRPVQKEVIEGEEDEDTDSNNGIPLNFNSRGMFDKMRRRRYERKFGEDELPTNENTSPSPSTQYFGPGASDISGKNIMNMMTQGQTGNYMDHMLPSTGNAQPPFLGVPPVSGTGVASPFRDGGMPMARAGKMVIKQQFGPQWDSVGQAITPTMDALTSLLNQSGLSDLENQIYNTGAYVPSIPMDQLGSRGNWGTASLTGKQMQYLKPLSEGISTYQNSPMAELATGIPFTGFKDGGDIPAYQNAGTTTNPGQFYNYALSEKKYFLDNPETWKEDPEMQNADGSFNLCIDCLNVDYDDPATVEDVVRLINEGHSQVPHLSAQQFNTALQKFGITPPSYGSLKQQMYGGSYEAGGTYELSDDEIQDIINRGGTVQYF